MVTRHAGGGAPRDPGPDPTRLADAVPAGTSSATLARRYGYARDPDAGIRAEEIPVRSRQYGADVLAGGTSGRRRPGQREVPKVAVERGLVVEDSEGRFCGAVAGYGEGPGTPE